jgi:Uma2 family endonuclease
VELIRGEIVTKMPVGKLHGALVKRLNQLLVLRLHGLAVIGVQDPIVLPDSQPEPDLTVLRPRDDFYASSKPTAADVRLVIEVADSSLAFDRENKLSLYALAGIEEYWIVNVDERKVEAYRQPRSTGEYSWHTDFSMNDRFSPIAFPELILSGSDIF